MERRGVYSVFETKDGRSITLRPLRRGDLEALVTFAKSLAKEKLRNPELGIISLDRRVTRADEKKFLDRTLEGLAKKRFVSVSAFHGSRMVGNCDIAKRTPRDVMHTGVLGIAIVEGYRGVGLGEKMIETALARALKIGAWLIELEVFATNASARALYEKLGFKVTGAIPKKMLRRGKLIDSVQMYIHLPQTINPPEGRAALH